MFFRNVDFIKQQAPSYLKSLGYDITGVEGIELSLLWGGYVWVQATRKEVPELVYTIKLRRQGNSLKWIYDRILNPEAAASANVYCV